jgi:serine/threonine-protein kinase
MEGGGEHLSPVADLSTGAAIAGYRIEALLGQGSMGTVYSALDVSLERRVALKVITPELSRDERFRERFLRESKLAASLEHPHIVPIHSAGEADGVLYLAMRFVEGRDLAELLKSLGRLDPERAIAILRQVASALDAAHARGLVHRDVKPANILISQPGSPHEHAYLCDFGLAKHTSTVSSLTGSRAILGTVDYLAPEQIEGKHVDGRVDVYALGCVLYECLTGDPPYERDNEIASLVAHVNDPPPTISDRRPELPEALGDVVAAALAKERDLRYPTCGDLVEAAQAALRGDAPAAPEARIAAPGIRTFLFADIRGYTSYTREHGDEAGAALARQFAAVVERLAPRHTGTMQELRGDEALVVFDSARRALGFALDLQRTVEGEQLPRPVGVGLDAGEAVPIEGGYRGGALNRAARLCALARPGEVLASDAVRELAGPTEGVTFGFRRVERLKGFDKPVGVVEIHPAERAPRRELARKLKRVAFGASPRKRLAVFAAVAAGAAGLTIGLVTVLGNPAKLPAAKSIVALGAATGKIVRSIDAGGEFQQIVTGDGALYGLDLDGGLIATIDPATGTIVDRAAAPDLKPSQVAPAVAYGSIWAADSRGTRLLRIDPRSPAAAVRIALPVPKADPNAAQQAEGIAVTKNGIWVTYGAPQRIARIDPLTNRVVFSRKLEGATRFQGSMLATDGETLWAVERDAHHIWRLDPRSGDTVTIGRIGNDTVEDAAVANGYLWVALQTGGGVWKVDDRGTTIRNIDTGSLPWVVVPAAGAIWIPNANDGTVTRIDAETDRTATFDVGHRPLGLAVVKAHVLVSLGLSAEDARSRIVGSRVLTVAVPGDPIATTDSGGTSVEVLALRQATGARLMAYRIGVDGAATVVPELASDPPTVSRDGLIYTFTVRKGFGFSPPSTEQVTAESLRYAIERARKEDDYCRYIFSVVRKIEATGDTIRFTLKTATGDLTARVAHPCASAVPVGTPVVEGGVAKPIPSAGPYYPDTHVFGQQVVLLRNPKYGGTRPQKLDAIVLKLGYSSDSAARAVERGEADLVVGEARSAGILAPDGPLAEKYGPAADAGAGRRYYRSPTTTTRSILLNYTHGPLRDVRLRQAVSLALDRAALASADGGTPQATMIPAGVPGRVEPLPRDVRPDWAKARALVGGRSVTLDAIIAPDLPEQAHVAELIRQELAHVGIKVKIRTDPQAVALAGDPKEGIDLVPLGWAMDFPDPGNTVTEVLAVAADEVWRQQKAPKPEWLRAAFAARRVTGPGRAATFRALDRRLTRVDVPEVIFDSQLGRPVFFSERVGCRRLLPLWEGLPDLSALCLRGKA